MNSWRINHWEPTKLEWRAPLLDAVGNDLVVAIEALADAPDTTKAWHKPGAVKVEYYTTVSIDSTMGVIGEAGWTDEAHVLDALNEAHKNWKRVSKLLATVPSPGPDRLVRIATAARRAYRESFKRRRSRMTHDTKGRRR